MLRAATLHTVAALLWIQCASGAKTYTIRGCVKDVNGTPVTGALVHVDGEDADSTRTDWNGCYKLGGLSGGRYTVWVETKGANSEAQQVKLTGKNSMVTVDLETKPASRVRSGTKPLINLETLRNNRPDEGVDAGAPSHARVDLKAEPIPNSITFDPRVIPGEGTSTATVGLSGIVLSGGVSIALWTSNPSVAQIPASVTSAPGATTVSFPVTVKQVRGPSDVSVELRASDGNESYSGVLVVQSHTRVTVKMAGTGSGAVVSLPPGISCGAKCSAPFSDFASVQLTARPAPGSVFAGWSGDCTKQGAVVVSGPMTCTATFTSQ